MHEPAAPSSRRFHVVFDVSDVINYFRSARLPTGIQRVQIEVVEYALRDASFDFSIACFTKEANYWVEVPRELFATLCTLSVGDFADSAWDELVESLEGIVVKGKPFQFAIGSILLNLGSSWWLQNYFVGVRFAKARFGILYVPFIHDLIRWRCQNFASPNCAAISRNGSRAFSLTPTFFWSIRRNTLADLQIAARKAGADREAAVIALDADFELLQPLVLKRSARHG